MDKNAIKKYAVWARNELIARVTQKAEQYEITEKKTTPKDADSINGRLLTDPEKNQRKALIEKIQADGFEQVMEEVAYTWFNRFTALRFMEVNNYLPSHTRVFTNEAGEFKPQILADAIQLDLEGLDMDKVFELKDANKTEELYKYLLITQCNALSSILPRMFQKIEHYTELLLPDYLLREGSVIEQMIALIPEEDWTDQVQIIGWLYQYYNSEPKDAVFAALKKNVKISKENIPAATQLFTPDWIVRYMVENSLGRLWLDGHPNDSLKSEWKYYLDEAKQEADVQKQLEEIRKEYAELKPEDIRCIDPCMGSGHILCYMFDVLVKIYEDYGYTAREAVGNIIEKNLWGLDIDERAAQLSYFAVMMKARQYDRRFFTRNIQPHVYAIEESNGITSAPMHDMGIELSQEEYGKAAKQAMRLVEEMHDAKEYGSIIHVTPCDWNLLRRFAVSRGESERQTRMDIHGETEAASRLQNLINIGEALSQSYQVAITNPPYMGSTGMGGKLSEYIKRHYVDSKGDLFAVFMERISDMLTVSGYQSMITQHAWMFLSSYEKLRRKIYKKQLVNMMHLGARAFDEIGGEVVQTTAFVFNNNKVDKYTGVYCRLVLGNSEKEKRTMFYDETNRYYAIADRFDNIPGAPIAYWIDPAVYECYRTGEKMSNLVHGFQGMITGNNDYYLRFWQEISFEKIITHEKHENLMDSNYTAWIPYKKGGGACRWFGNSFYVLRWEKSGKGLTRARTENSDYYLREGVTWSYISTNSFSANYYPQGYLWDVHGSSIFANDHKDLLYYIAMMNSCVGNYLLTISNPTLSFQVENILALPVIKDSSLYEKVVRLAEQAIELCNQNWNNGEISWEFEKHVLIKDKSLISECYEEWSKESRESNHLLKKIEEEINECFIQIYGLNRTLKSDVDASTVNYAMANLSEDVKSFISYAVGCMFGRYSLDTPGIAFAGGSWDPDKYKSFQPDKDAIIPICDDEYFEDDIVGRFVKFMEIVYGKNTLEENLKFISDALGGKGTPRDVIRSYFINDFYSDHLKTYQKRPIYWLFDSGKKNGFKCLVYVHRYQSDTVARIRTDYVHEQQSRYRTAITDLEQRISGAATSERVKLNKQLTLLQAQATEIREYEEKIHHLADQMISIDLDDGVKHNYNLFKDVLAKLK